MKAMVLKTEQSRELDIFEVIQTLIKLKIGQSC